MTYGGPRAGADAQSATALGSGISGAVDDAIAAYLEPLLRQAQPRLMRLARSFGIVGDEADDVVQETQIRAWRRLQQLRSAERFDAWLDAICRNQCRMYLRSRANARCTQGHAPAASACAQHSPHPSDPERAFLTAAAGLAAADEEEGGLPYGEVVADEPYAALERQELADLVERALGYLPHQARAAVKLHDLQGWTLAEVAASLDASITAQEMRLRRARARLREVLLGPLRDEAVALGVVDFASEAASVTDTGGAPAWQTTRITCYLCGQRALEGRFEYGANGRRELRLRCPGCTRRHGIDVFRSKGLAPLDGVRMFRPALTRAMRALQTHGQRVIASGRDLCLHCGTAVRRAVVTAEAYPDALPVSLGRHWVVAPCPRAGCPGLGAWAVAEPALWSTPLARQFMSTHPRWVLGPDDVARWQERPAILLRMTDRESAARLAVVVDAGTLDVLDTVEA